MAAWRLDYGHACRADCKPIVRSLIPASNHLLYIYVYIYIYTSDPFLSVLMRLEHSHQMTFATNMFHKSATFGVTPL